VSRPKNRLGEDMLSDGEVLDLVYVWLAMQGTIPELQQILHDNEEMNDGQRANGEISIH